MTEVEVFADITCPFAHVGLRRLVAERARRNRPDVRFAVRSWPLELVDGTPLTGPALAPKVAALRAGVAPDLFAGFDPDRFPATSLPALALVAAAREHDPDAAERLDVLLRDLLFEGGHDIADAAVLSAAATRCGLAGLAGDPRAVLLDREEGTARGVRGSPHFFLPAGDWFCPSLEITHPDGGLQVAFDQAGFEDFTTALFG